MESMLVVLDENSALFVSDCKERKKRIEKVEKGEQGREECRHGAVP